MVVVQRQRLEVGYDDGGGGALRLGQMRLTSSDYGQNPHLEKGYTLLTCARSTRTVSDASEEADAES